MPNQKLTELPSLTSTTAAPNDITVVVDVSDLASPSGNTKNMTLNELGVFLTQNKNLVSSSAQIDPSQVTGVATVTVGGTGANYLHKGIVVSNDTSAFTSTSGSAGQVLAETINGPAFIDGVVSASQQVSFPLLANLPVGLVSGSGQLQQGLFSSSAQTTFIGQKDTPSSYTPNSVVVSNASGTGLLFISGSENAVPIDQQIIGGRSFANGTFYFNGDIRERMYANPTPTNLYSGSYSPFFENFLHSGNIFYDNVSESIYFVRGTWPRRQGQSATDLKGLTWREGNVAGLSKAEAICKSRDDGQNFQVLLDLYATNFANSELNSVQNGSGVNIVADPSAVVYDAQTGDLYFACRNDHDASIIYKVNLNSTSSNDIINSGQVWVQMASGNQKIDSLDLVTIPQNYYALNNPSQNTKVLLFGTSPDYISSTNTSVHQNAAVFMVPTDNAPGIFAVEYPVSYTLHLFWAASLDTTQPDMSRTGVKGIKTVFANVNGGEWNPVTDDPADVDPTNSRIYVVSSGAASTAPYYAASQTYANLGSTASLYTSASTVPANPGGAGSIPGITTPLAGIPFNGPSIAPAGQVPAFFNNEQFGGHAVLELLIGNVAGSDLYDNFSFSTDSTRPYKTWRSGILQQDGSTTVLNLGADDPSQPSGTPASGPGAARGLGFAANDRLFILTSLIYPNDFNGQTPVGTAGCRGVVRISDVNCDGSELGSYTLEGGDGSTGLNAVMVIPILANSIDSDITSMQTGGQEGLQQIAVDVINGMFYVADCFYSRYWSTIMSSMIAAGITTTNPFPSNPTPNPAPAPAFNFPAVPGGSPTNYPPVPALNPIPNATVGTGVSGSVVPGTQVLNSVIPGNPVYNPPPYVTPTGNFNPNTGGTPTGGFNPTNFNPANYNPTVYNIANNPVIPGVTGTPSVTTTLYGTIVSEFGTIYEGNLFVYSRDTNGQRIFDNNNPQIAYSRPVGLAGYNTGPANEFRLIYTNAENNFALLNNNLGFGIYINGLSRTFVKDGILAQGRNVFSVSDAGPGPQGGIVVTFDYPANSSDYALTAFSSNETPLGSGQSHGGDPQTFVGSIDPSYPQNDGAYYYSKNRSQCRITYTSGSLPDVVYFACFDQ
jgi:hypothetical protein